MGRRARRSSVPAVRFVFCEMRAAEGDPEKSRDWLRAVQRDVDLTGRGSVEPSLWPVLVTQAFEQSASHIFQAAKELQQRTAQLGRQATQKTATLQQLNQDVGNLQQQIIRLPILRVDTVDVLQVQTAVLLAVEPLILDGPTIASSFLGD